jgi:diguanylate cyclase (GGDEF)-like protein
MRRKRRNMAMNEKPKILIADDSEINRALLKEILGDGYDYLEAEDGAAAVELMRQRTDISLLLLDLMMPGMDGFDVLRVMKYHAWLDEIPVIVISAAEDTANIERAYDLGVTDYIRRPFERIMVLRRVKNILMLYAKQKRLTRLVTDQVYEKEHNSVLMISILSHVVEFRNSESGLHVLHIRTLTDLLLHRLVQKTDRYQLDESDIALISTASALHDIGKIVIPEEILNKPGRLTAEEFAIIKNHTVAGAQMGQAIARDEPLLQVAHAICRWHHERWDGNGYPDRLKEDEIPIAAQVVALADVYDALTSERCYKHAYDHDTALRMILNGECGAFNPLLLDCLRESSEQLRTELTRSEWDRGFRQETHRLSEEILHREALPRENHSQLLLEQEKERTDFYAAQCGGIRFDYDLLAGSVTVYDYHAEPLQQKTVTDFAQGKGLSFLNEQDRRKLSKAISRATPEAPDVVLPVMVQRDGKPHLHRMALHTIWSGAGVRRCVNVLGHLTDEQHRVEHQAELLTAIDPEEDPARFLRRLQGIFDVVRLVDPEHRKVLALDSDGILTEKPGNCHMVWNKDTRCENCISAKAYARKTILNKIEFKDEEAYFVISKYIEVGGRGCMLEMVTRLTDGRWLDMGGHRLLLDRCNGMERSAFVDPLTGAYTRRYFDKFLAGGEMHGGVAMIDVNQFKSVNDSFGHLVGDEALQTVAAAMQSCLRQTDILIRYGGDEFLLLMPQNCPDGVESVIRRVQSAVQAARVPSHPELRLSVSIGGVCNVQPLTEAIRQADARMYCNKENGEPVL